MGTNHIQRTEPFHTYLTVVNSRYNYSDVTDEKTEAQDHRVSHRQDSNPELIIPALTSQTPQVFVMKVNKMFLEVPTPHYQMPGVQVLAPLQVPASS